MSSKHQNGLPRQYHWCSTDSEKIIIYVSTIPREINNDSYTNTTPIWCAILIAHQVWWQIMEAAVSICQESPLVGEPREILFYILSFHRCQLFTKYLYTSTLLWQVNGYKI